MQSLEMAQTEQALVLALRVKVAQLQHDIDYLAPRWHMPPFRKPFDTYETIVLRSSDGEKCAEFYNLFEDDRFLVGSMEFETRKSKYGSVDLGWTVAGHYIQVTRTAIIVCVTSVFAKPPISFESLPPRVIRALVYELCDELYQWLRESNASVEKQVAARDVLSTFKAEVEILLAEQTQ